MRNTGIVAVLCCILASGCSRATNSAIVPGAASLHFAAVADGIEPAAALIGVNGLFYGTTRSGGAFDGGTVFSIDSLGAEQVLHSFGGAGDGVDPTDRLVERNGTLYGTTRRGGKYSKGTVFELGLRAPRLYGVVHSFGGPSDNCLASVPGADGCNPSAGLIDVDGTFYGTTERGGRNGGGIFFSLNSGDVERIIYSFGKSGDGIEPIGDLIRHNGAFYGATTYGGGEGKAGTIFSVFTNGVERVLHAFSGGSDGRNPNGDLVILGDHFYGTTQSGGTQKRGTVFDIPMRSFLLVTIHGFGGADGASPRGGLIAVDHTLYGVTQFGGANNKSTVFAVSPFGAISVLHSFGDGSGIFPLASLVEANGTLYGTTWKGTDRDAGSVFSVTREGKFTSLHSFGGSTTTPLNEQDAR